MVETSRLTQLQSLIYRLITNTDSVYNSLSAVLDETDAQRRDRYLLNWAYYRNKQYDSAITAGVSGHAARRASEVLYRKIKPLFNVCTRCADLDAAAVLPEPLELQIPNAKADAVVRPVWEQLLNLLGRMNLWGSVYGDVYWRLANEFKNPTPVLHSPRYFDVTYDPLDSQRIIRADLSYSYTDPTNDRAYKYSLIITPDMYATLRDGRPYAYAQNPIGQGGKPMADWENELGVVPVAHVKLLDAGETYGLSTFQDVLPQLDAVNEIASYMAEIIRLHAKPQFVAKWIESGTLTKGDSDKGEDNVWYLNADPAMVAQGADPDLSLLEWSGAGLQGMNEFLDQCKTDIQSQLPEWHLQRVRDQAQPSGYSVALQLTELNTKLGRMRSQAQSGIETLLGFALMAKGMDPRVDAEWTTGDFLPKDQQYHANLVYSDLGARLIDRKEALRQRGYPEDKIDGLIQAADEEAEARNPFSGYEPGSEADTGGDDGKTDGRTEVQSSAG